MLDNFLKMLANVTIINLLIFLFYYIREMYIYIYIFLSNFSLMTFNRKSYIITSPYPN